MGGWKKQTYQNVCLLSVLLVVISLCFVCKMLLKQFEVRLKRQLLRSKNSKIILVDVVSRKEGPFKVRWGSVASVAKKVILAYATLPIPVFLAMPPYQYRGFVSQNK